MSRRRDLGPDLEASGELHALIRIFFVLCDPPRGDCSCVMVGNDMIKFHPDVKMKKMSPCMFALYF